MSRYDGFSGEHSGRAARPSRGSHSAPYRSSYARTNHHTDDPHEGAADKAAPSIHQQARRNRSPCRSR
ncbi:hypothetical protein D9M68_648200 [compost metagenome]